jgi:hypothetical protein
MSVVRVKVSAWNKEKIVYGSKVTVNPRLKAAVVKLMDRTDGQLA